MSQCQEFDFYKSFERICEIGNKKGIEITRGDPHQFIISFDAFDHVYYARNLAGEVFSNFCSIDAFYCTEFGIDFDSHKPMYPIKNTKAKKHGISLCLAGWIDPDLPPPEFITSNISNRYIRCDGAHINKVRCDGLLNFVNEFNP